VTTWELACAVRVVCERCMRHDTDNNDDKIQNYDDNWPLVSNIDERALKYYILCPRLSPTPRGEHSRKEVRKSSFRLCFLAGTTSVPWVVDAGI
jgi:hypothetical protein